MLSEPNNALKEHLSSYNKFTDRYHGFLSILMLILFLSLMAYIYVNAEAIKTNPCKVCTEKLDMMCMSKKGILYDPVKYNRTNIDEIYDRQ